MGNPFSYGTEVSTRDKDSADGIKNGQTWRLVPRCDTLSAIPRPALRVSRRFLVVNLGQSGRFAVTGDVGNGKRASSAINRPPR